MLCRAASVSAKGSQSLEVAAPCSLPLAGALLTPLSGTASGCACTSASLAPLLPSSESAAEMAAASAVTEETCSRDEERLAARDSASSSATVAAVDEMLCLPDVL